MEVSEKLIDIAAQIVETATWYPEDEYATEEMIVPSSLIRELSEALREIGEE